MRREDLSGNIQNLEFRLPKFRPNERQVCQPLKSLLKAWRCSIANEEPKKLSLGGATP